MLKAINPQIPEGQAKLIKAIPRCTIIKFLKSGTKEKIWKAVKEERYTVNRGRKRRMTPDFPSELCKSEKSEATCFIKHWKKKNYQPRILHPAGKNSVFK